MKWAKMQEPLARGFQVFRLDWPDDQYLMREGENLMLVSNITLFSAEHPEGVPFEMLSSADAEADDWVATGPSGE